MFMKKQKDKGICEDDRHKQQVDLEQILIDAKEKELEELIKERNGVKHEFESLADYQRYLAEAAEYRTEIYEKTVALEMLHIKKAELESQSALLHERKEELSVDKKEAEEKNEDLKK